MTYPYAQNPNIEAIRRNRMSVKRFFSNSNALTIAILYTISAALTLISSLFSSPIMNEALEELFDSLDLDVEMSSTFNISIPVLPILIAIAFFLIYAAGKNKKPDTANSAGATILFVISIIQLVIFCLALLLVVAVILLMVVFASSASSKGSGLYFGYINGYVDTSSVLLVTLLIMIPILIGVITLSLVYFIGMVKFSGSLRKGLTTTVLTANGAKAVGVCNIFFAIFSGIAMLVTLVFSGISIVNLSSISSSAFIDNIIYLIILCISSVIAFIININMSIFAFNYNKHIQMEAQNIRYYTDYTQNNAYNPAPDAQVPYNENQHYHTNYNYYDNALHNAVTTEPETVDHTVIADEPCPAPSVCPDCGTTIGENQAFCSECGRRLN